MDAPRSETNVPETTDTTDRTTDPIEIITRSVRERREVYERLAACGGSDAYLYRLALAFNDGRDPNPEDVRQFTERTTSTEMVLTGSASKSHSEPLQRAVRDALVAWSRKER
ncbi:hypothetical protein DEQ92_04165 [Haloferax sp. Atlit-6N]|nr:hypothetical protein DEQ92_04165 [Haloferax sp. Atlit-6N]